MFHLELNRVSHAYRRGGMAVPVLREINLSITPGEFVAIVGYSGSGKTTLINLMSGLLKPTQGTVRVREADGPPPGPDRAVVFQNYSLLPWLTVHDNVALAVNQVFPHWPSARRKAHVLHHLDLVNLTAARDKRPGELSGGMRQRVSVARALAIDPEILLLDEPLGALDALTRAILQDEIGRLCRESRKTVILITNDPDEGILLADRIIPLSAGPNATLGPSITIDLPHPRDRKTLGLDPHFKAVRRQVLEFLLGAGGKPKQSVQRRLVLPDIEPEDLSHPRRWWNARGTPRRRAEEREEKLEVS